MKSLISLILLLVSMSLMADNHIHLSNLQIFNLGVKTGTLKAVKKVPLLYAPAKVVIPPTQEHVASASQAGLVSKLLVTVGDKVKKGQIIGQLNSPELLVLQQQFLRAQSEKNLALVNFQRDKRLLDGGIIARKRWYEAKSRYHNSESEVNANKQLLAIAGMSTTAIKSLASNRRLNSKLNIYAPISGVVLEQLVRTGERLGVFSPVYKIANLNKLWLEIKLPQEQMANIKLGDQVKIQGTEITTKISLLGNSVDKETQTVLARAIVHGKTTKLRVGQQLNTQIVQQSHQVFFEVQNVAIAQNEGEFYIFVRTEAGFLAKQIKVLGKEGSYSVITGNLIGTEEIATRGAVALKANWLGLGAD